ncbi:hypothetical protein H9L39_04524 [Fusarium oxysporum f. sp. albedinis]|nr:hypothetical protein H9L39_04524 [Fusarium oxysporum f. sp. albedinis]
MLKGKHPQSPFYIAIFQFPCLSDPPSKYFALPHLIISRYPLLMCPCTSQNSFQVFDIQFRDTSAQLWPFPACDVTRYTPAKTPRNLSLTAQLRLWFADHLPCDVDPSSQNISNGFYGQKSRFLVFAQYLRSGQRMETRIL